MAQPTLITLHPKKYSQELRYYPLAVNLDRCVGSCNTFDDLSDKVFVPNEAKELNLYVFNMMTGINKSKILTKHISYKCECKFDSRKYYWNKKYNNDKCRCDCE